MVFKNFNFVLLYKKAYLKVLKHFNIIVKKRIKTKEGFFINIILPEDVSSIIYLNREYEPELTNFIKNYLKKGDIFVDVGTHFGYFTLLASKIVGHFGEVHSFEPTPSTFNILKENCLGISNIKLNNNAVYFKDKKIKLKDCGIVKSAFNCISNLNPRLNNQINYNLFNIQAIRLDSYFSKGKKGPNFIKIDAEDSEFEILKGALKTIKKFKPLISVEVGDGFNELNKNSRKLIEYVTNLGYIPYEYFDGEIIPHQLRTKYRYDNILLIPNNR
jgi:FkbM family methyltransferase